jgi:hypothetical protein
MLEQEFQSLGELYWAFCFLKDKKPKKESDREKIYKLNLAIWENLYHTALAGKYGEHDLEITLKYIYDRWGI